MTNTGTSPATGGVIGRALAVLLLLPFGLTAAVLTSPDGRLQAEVGADGAGAWHYTVRTDDREIVAPSRLGITIEGVDLGVGAIAGSADYGEIDETYPLLGGKARARNHARTLRLALSHPRFAQRITLEARAYDDGFAWRLIVPGEGLRRVNGEASAWTLPPESRVWYFERASAWKLKSYAGEWRAAHVSELANVSPGGPVQGLPVVAELASGAGFVLVTEAALENYSGLRLRTEAGTRRIVADFTEGEEGFLVEGTITTPWRVTLVARDLNALATSDLVTHLTAPPDPALYANTSYIRLGRAVWRWWSKGTGTPEEERRMIDDAAELGFEYSLVDDGWKEWPDAWDAISRLCEHGHERGVRVLVWKDYKEVADPTKNWARLRTFLDRAKAAGVAGVKLDFLNAESKDRVDFTVAACRLAAERRLLVIFHGVAKPTGEARTYPNEITREAIRGLELNRMKEGPIPSSHNVVLPFTRFVVGPGDYTPLGYSNPGATTWAHQLATFVQFHSPLQIMAEHPDKILRDPATRAGLEVLCRIPSVWDETRVLPASRMGELSVMARRSGDTWFLSVLNGTTARRLEEVPLSFLGSGHYRMVEVTSPDALTLSRRDKSGVVATNTWSLSLAAGDGAVLMFTK